jgi:hypothetical protein
MKVKTLGENDGSYKVKLEEFGKSIYLPNSPANSYTIPMAIPLK